MGKLARLRNKVETFAVLFWAFGIVIANTAVHKACPYMVMVGSNLTEDALPTKFFSIGTVC